MSAIEKGGSLIIRPPAELAFIGKGLSRDKPTGSIRYEFDGETPVRHVLCAGCGEELQKFEKKGTRWVAVKGVPDSKLIKISHPAGDLVYSIKCYNKLVLKKNGA